MNSNLIVSSILNTSYRNKQTESESEGDFDLFQLEIVSDEEVYVCNLCNEGLDSAHEVKEHIKETHKKFF